MLDIVWYVIAILLILATLPGAIELIGLTGGAILHLWKKSQKKKT
jgi:hypothetical protein